MCTQGVCLFYARAAAAATHPLHTFKRYIHTYIPTDTYLPSFPPPKTRLPSKTHDQPSPPSHPNPTPLGNTRFLQTSNFRTRKKGGGNLVWNVCVMFYAAKSKGHKNLKKKLPLRRSSSASGAFHIQLQC